MSDAVTQDVLTIIEGGAGRLRLNRPRAIHALTLPMCTAMIETVLAGRWPTGQRPERWDGNTADRCVAALRERSANLRAASQQP